MKWTWPWKISDKILEERLNDAMEALTQRLTQRIDVLDGTLRGHDHPQIAAQFLAAVQGQAVEVDSVVCPKCGEIYYHVLAPATVVCRACKCQFDADILGGITER